MNQELLTWVVKLGSELSGATLEQLAVACSEPTQRRGRAIRRAVTSPKARALIDEFLAATDVSALQGDDLGFALMVAGASAQSAKEAESIEVVWTGPETGMVPTRRTDQVVMELARESRAELWLMSYVFVRADDVIAELERAANRGVAVNVALESSVEEGGTLNFSGFDSLSRRLPQATLFEWPADQRPRNESRNIGSQHAKCVVRDREALFVTSANLTDHALSLNMELGLLVRGGNSPEHVADHLQALVDSGKLIKRS